MDNGQEIPRVQKKILNDVLKKFGPKVEDGIPINVHESEDSAPMDYIANNTLKSIKQKRNPMETNEPSTNLTVPYDGESEKIQKGGTKR